MSNGNILSYIFSLRTIPEHLQLTRLYNHRSTQYRVLQKHQWKIRLPFHVCLNRSIGEESNPGNYDVYLPVYYKK